MTTLAIANQKGGVAKTTTAINIAYWFSHHDYRVLIVDLDGQGHVATGFKLEKSNGLYRLLVEGREGRSVVEQARPNLDVITNDHTGELVKVHIQQATFKEYVLANALEDAQTQYDLVILDTPPSTDVLHVLALIASDYLVIPSNMDFYALDGIGYIFKTLRALARYPGVTPPAVIGVLPTLFDRTTAETIGNVQKLQELLGPEKILPPIPRDTKVREASACGMTIWEYAPKSPAAVGFAQRGVKLKNSQGNVGGYLHLCEIIEALL